MALPLSLFVVLLILNGVHEVSSSDFMMVNLTKHVVNLTKHDRRLVPWEEKPTYTVACTASSECGSGQCTTDLECVCQDDHYTAEEGSPCSVKKKSRNTAIILHVLVGWTGAGPFWLGWTMWGVILLALFIPLCCCAGPAMFAGARSGPEGGGGKKVAGACCCCSLNWAYVGVWIQVLLWICDGDARNGDGVPLT